MRYKYTLKFKDSKGNEQVWQTNSQEEWEMWRAETSRHIAYRHRWSTVDE